MKRKMTGTALAMLISLAMAFTLIPLIAGTAYADTELVIDGVRYSLHDEEATVSGHTDDLSESITLLGTVSVGDVDYAVTSIGGSAFQGTGITGITIPASVTSIGEYAFQGTGITGITIPASVTSIGEYAFADCSNLGTVAFAGESNLACIGGGAFAGTGITGITIPASVTSIGEYAFQGTGITGITIPASVTSIGEYAFADCSNLGTVAFAGESNLACIEAHFREPGSQASRSRQV